jgi:hypothetical protein
MQYSSLTVCTQCNLLGRFSDRCTSDGVQSIDNFWSQGETIVFIATEYLDPKYKGPVTGKKHILTMEDDIRGT